MYNVYRWKGKSKRRIWSKFSILLGKFLVFYRTFAYSGDAHMLIHIASIYLKFDEGFCVSVLLMATWSKVLFSNPTLINWCTISCEWVFVCYLMWAFVKFTLLWHKLWIFGFSAVYVVLLSTWVRSIHAEKLQTISVTFTSAEVWLNFWIMQHRTTNKMHISLINENLLPKNL